MASAVQPHARRYAARVTCRAARGHVWTYPKAKTMARAREIRNRAMQANVTTNLVKPARRALRARATSASTAFVANLRAAPRANRATSQAVWAPARTSPHSRMTRIRQTYARAPIRAMGWARASRKAGSRARWIVSVSAAIALETICASKRAQTCWFVGL